MVGEAWKLAAEGAAWALAAVWCVHTRALMSRLGEIPDLTEDRWDLAPAGAPGLVVVVPAKDEAATLRPAMETLLAQDYPWMRIIAVNDRSTDSTGAILEELAASRPDRLTVLHLDTLAEGWIAKTLAMETAVARSRSQWLLFTDADVWISPSLLRRALSFAEMTDTDHLVITPTPVIQSWGESTMLGFLAAFSLWASRPWQVQNQRSKRDLAGLGAFNLLRREVLEELGGLAPQRLAVVEDVTLGARVRAAGYRQRLAFAPGLLLIHWATGARGIIRGMTKNLFAVVGFRFRLLTGAALGVVVLFLLPLAGLAWWRTLLPSLVILACLGVTYRELAEVSGIEARWGLLYPVGTVGLLWAMLRSAVVTVWQRGIRWRDTFYPLHELRPHNDLFAWEREAARMRAEQRRQARRMGRQWWTRAAKRTRRSPAQQPGPARNDAPHTHPE